MILPKPFPDEAITSLLARLCRLNGIADYGDAVTLLFGHGLHTTFINAPVDVVEFCVRTKGAYSEPVEVLENLTWMGAAGRLEVASPSRGTYVAAGLVKPTLAEMTFPESVSLRYCPACRKRDLLGYGMSYWRRQHQIPIVWYCADHGELLVKVPMKRADLHTTFPLPGDFKRLDSACVARRHAPGDFMQAVAHLVRVFFAWQAPPSPALIHASIVSELRARRLLSDRGRLHLSEFSAQLRPLLLIPEASGTGEVQAKLLKQLSRFVINPSQASLTFEALLLVQWLFGGLAGLKEKCAWLQVIGVPMLAPGPTNDSTGFELFGAFHRHRCIQFIREHPGCSRLDFTKFEYRSFRWLLHHDAEWLNGQLPLNSREGKQLFLF